MTVVRIPSQGNFELHPPTDGHVYIFGGGSIMHHSRDCYYSSRTREDDVIAVPDADGDLWQRLIKTREAVGLKNAFGQPVSETCLACTLTRTDDTQADIVLVGT